MRDFVVSPGFAGLLALLAAIVAAGALLYSSRRARQRFEQRRDEQDRREDLARDKALTWERWQWVVENAGIEPAVSEGATLGLGPAVTLELLGGLLRDADRLGDETLARAVAVYQEQLVLVLAQQAGPVTEVAAAAVPAADPETTAFATQSEPVRESSGGRRRR